MHGEVNLVKLDMTRVPKPDHPRTMSLARTVLRAGGGRHIVRVTNALVRSHKEAMSVASDGHRLTWYACGPTVYDDAHLGHARTYVAFDVARRILSRLARVRVDFCMGVTDVDDKIIDRAREHGVSPRALARDYEARFFADMSALNVRPPSRVMRVTEHIPDIVRTIAELVESDAAYPTADGSVYFRVGAAARYGVLDPSRGKKDLPPEDDGHTNVTLKQDHRDFALWKGGQGKVNPEYARWDSPWGVGRPGWHVECTAMIRASMGDHIDVHSGGIDLRFPHHENELVIANELKTLCGCAVNDENGRRWVQSWLHTGQLRIGGDKMSKSTKNFVTVREYFEEGGDPDVFRMFCLKHRYGAPVEYNEDRLRDARNFLRRCKNFVESNTDGMVDGDYSSKSLSARKLTVALERCREAVEEALVDDFDTPTALTEIAMLMTVVNSEGKRDGATALVCAEAGRLVGEVLGMLGVSGFGEVDQGDNKVDGGVVDELVVFRNMVRSAAMARDWGRVFAACDGVRSVLRDRFGVEVRDGEEKLNWERTGPGSTSPFTGRMRPVTTEMDSDSDN